MFTWYPCLPTAIIPSFDNFFSKLIKGLGMKSGKVVKFKNYTSWMDEAAAAFWQSALD